MKMKSIVMGLFACTSLFACATDESDGEPTTITPAHVENNDSGGVTVTGDGVTIRLDDPALIELFGTGTSVAGGEVDLQVGCQISSCDSCTCYPDGKCICTNCKCISR